MNTSFAVSAWTSFFRVSMPLPPLPMTMPGPRGEDVDLHLVRGALDLDGGETPACPRFALTNFLIRMSSCSHLREVLLRVPLRVPAADDARRKPTDGVSDPCETRPFPFSSLLRVSTSTVTCDVRLTDEAVGRDPSTGPSSAAARDRSRRRPCDDQVVGVGLVVLGGVGDRRSSTLTSIGPPCGCWRRRIDIAPSTERPRITSATDAHLAGRFTEPSQNCACHSLVLVELLLRRACRCRRAGRHRRPPPCARRSGRGRCASARTRRACARPCSRSRTRARTCARCARRR